MCSTTPAKRAPYGMPMQQGSMAPPQIWAPGKQNLFDAGNAANFPVLPSPAPAPPQPPPAPQGGDPNDPNNPTNRGRVFGGMTRPPRYQI